MQARICALDDSVLHAAVVCVAVATAWQQGLGGQQQKVTSCPALEHRALSMQETELCGNPATHCTSPVLGLGGTLKLIAGTQLQLFAGLHVYEAWQCRP